MSDTRPSTKKDPKTVAAAVFVALIVLAGIALVGAKVLNGDDHAGKTGKPSGGSSSGHYASSSSFCGLPDGNQAIPTSAPKTDWYFKGNLATPRSAAFGPGKRGDVASCFARSPAGALFAATTLATDIYPRDQRTKRALKLRAVPGPALEAALKEDLGAPGPISQIVGFRFEDYTRDRATVTLAARLTDGPDAGALGATPLTMVWRDGDWYIELQAAGTPIVLSSLDGFVKWSGIS